MKDKDGRKSIAQVKKNNKIQELFFIEMTYKKIKLCRISQLSQLSQNKTSSKKPG